MTSLGDEQGALDEQAIAWLVQLHAADDTRSAAETDADWNGLEAWLSADPAHLAAFERVEGLWAELGERAAEIAPRLAPDDLSGAEILPFAPGRKAPASQPAASGWPARAWATWGAVAGVAAAAAVAALTFAPVTPTAYATGRGEIRHIVLADGTQIDMNSGSRIAVSFDGRARRVKIDDAEATFDVAHDTKRPFLISVGDQQIRVVGTQFNVRRRDSGLTLTVSRGVVEVRPLAGEADPVRLVAGDQLAHHDGDTVSTVKRAPPADAFAWREHRLICHDCTLGGVAEDLNRAFTVPIEVTPAARSLTFTGVLVLDDEDAVVKRLGAFLPIKADRSGSQIVLSSSR